MRSALIAWLSVCVVGVAASAWAQTAKPEENPKITDNYLGGKTATTTDAQKRVTREEVRGKDGKIRDLRVVLYDDKKKTVTEYNQHYDDQYRMTNDNNTCIQDGKVLSGDKRDWTYANEKDKEGTVDKKVWDKDKGAWVPAPSTLPRVRVGLEGGATFATLAANDDEFNSHQRLGLAGGAYFDYLLDRDDDLYDFIFDVILATKGARFPISEEDDAVLGLKYLNVNALFRYRIVESRPYAVRVAAGPSFGWKWLEHVTENGQPVDSPAFASAADFGVAFQGEVQFHSRMSVCARYTLGLINIVKEPGPSMLSVHNRSLQVMFAYQLTKPSR